MLNRVSLGFTLYLAAAAAGIVVLGSMFMDSPDADAAGFVRAVAGPVLQAGVAWAACTVGSRVLLRAGWTGVAAAVAILPVPVGLAAVLRALAA